MTVFLVHLNIHLLCYSLSVLDLWFGVCLQFWEFYLLFISIFIILSILYLYMWNLLMHSNYVSVTPFDMVPQTLDAMFSVVFFSFSFFLAFFLFVRASVQGISTGLLYLHWFILLNLALSGIKNSVPLEGFFFKSLDNCNMHHSS